MHQSTPIVDELLHERAGIPVDSEKKPGSSRSTGITDRLDRTEQHGARPRRGHPAPSRPDSRRAGRASRRRCSAIRRRSKLDLESTRGSEEPPHVLGVLVESEAVVEAAGPTARDGELTDAAPLALRLDRRAPAGCRDPGHAPRCRRRSPAVGRRDRWSTAAARSWSARSRAPRRRHPMPRPGARRSAAPPRGSRRASRRTRRARAGTRARAAGPARTARPRHRARASRIIARSCSGSTRSSSR